MSDTFFKNEEINAKIKEYLEQELSENRKNRFGYFIINKKNLKNICIINNHPAWFELYAKFNHQMVDPIVIKSLTRVEDFSWDEAIIISSKLSLPRVMLHAKEYNINGGHTFILHDHKSNIALLSIFDDATTRPEKRFTINREKLSFLLIKTHQKLLSLYEIFEGDTKRNVLITKKENEVLYWACTGKTYKEISLIVGIQETTIKFHIRNVVRKLDAVNAKHAIRLATELKLVKIPNSY